MTSHIAKEKGLAHDDPHRLVAHLEHAIVTQSRETGSYWLATDGIVSDASTLMQKLWPIDATLQSALHSVLGDARFATHGDTITTLAASHGLHHWARASRASSYAPLGVCNALVS